MSGAGDESDTAHLKVADVMSTKPVIVDCDVSVEEAAIQMDKGGLGYVLVSVRGVVDGILTERDIVRRVVAKGLSPKSTRVKEVMSRPIIAVTPETPVEDALKIMSKNGVRRLPVVVDGKLVGVVTLMHVAKAVSAQWEYINEILAALTSQSSTTLEPFA